MFASRLCVAFVRVALTPVVLLVFAHALASAEENDQAPKVANAGEPDPVRKLPIHFILNPDDGRPPDYPAEITLEKLALFLKTQTMLGQGCGGMTWEGKFCGMFCNAYAPTKTPWLKDEADFDACYAQTKTGTFLASFMLGRNRYGRADRNSDKLTWKKNYEPEHEAQAINRVLLGGDSAKRQTLLTKISDSFRNLDLTQFPSKSRESLRLQVRQCENDPDPAVVALAKEIQTELSAGDSRP